MRNALVHTRHGRIALVTVALGVIGGVLVWRAPDLHYVGRAFTSVRWEWVAAAIGINLFSVVVRSVAWHVVLTQALPDPHPTHRQVFSAFSVGLLGNAVIPGRVGEVARIAALARHLPEHRGTWASILGSVFAHRMFDVIPTIGLVVYVVVSARIPRWALPGVEIMVAIGAVLLVTGFVLAWRHRHRESRLPAGAGRLRRLAHESVGGLRVLHSPGPALLAAFCQLLGWAAQLLAVYIAFKAFRIDEPLAAAGVVLLAINVAIAFPLWPGSVGLFQAAAALALLPYGIAYQHGFAYGIGLQAIEMSVGVGLGLIFIAREGISFAMLRKIPRVTEGIEGDGDGVDPATEPPLPSRPQVVRGRQHGPVRTRTSERAG